jgi:hypothetical protein
VHGLLCLTSAPLLLLVVCREQHQNSSVVLELLSKKTAKEQARLDQYRSHGAAVQAQCEHMTKEACMAANNAPRACHKMHKRCVRCCHLCVELAYGLLSVCALMFDRS